MQEIAGIALAFVIIVVLISRKKPLGLVMFLASLIVLAAAGGTVGEIIGVIWSALKDQDTIDLVLIVATITALAGFLQEFDFFKHMVNALRQVLRSDRITLMLVPGLVGCMPMVGGAIVSAPMVDTLGEHISLPPARRSAANLMFRHSWYFIFPFLPTYILAARLSGIEVLDLIRLQWPLTAVMLAAGYFFILRGGNLVEVRADDSTQTTQQSANAESEATYQSLPAAAASFGKYASPIIVSLVLSIGFRLHLALALLCGLLLTVILVSNLEKQGFKPSSAPGMILQKIDYNIVGAMAGIMVFRAGVDQTTAFGDLMTTLLQAGVPLYAVAGGLAFIVGYVSASHSSTLAVVLPIILPVIQASGEPVLPYVMFIYCFGFIAYLISPLHLCQILTNRYFEVSLGEVYRIYMPVVLLVAATGIALMHLI